MNGNKVEWWDLCIRASYHGKHIFRNVMNSLSHHYNLFEATEFVLSGSSAGGFGVGMNCDDVAQWLHVRKKRRSSHKITKYEKLISVLRFGSCSVYAG